MSTRQGSRIHLHRPLVIAIAIAAVAALAITGVTLAAASGPSPQKQAALAKAQSAAATRAAGPRAPKPTIAPTSAPAAAPASCPQPPITTGIGRAWEAPFHADATFTNVAGTISAAGDFYYIYAGAVYSNPVQGVLIAQVEDGDPCKVSHGQVASHAGLFTYPSPFQRGALTLTRIAGDSVDFSVADGSHSSFNFVTGQYASS